jgi:recombination protein RecA
MGAAILQLRSELQARFDVPFTVTKAKEQSYLATGIQAIDRLTGGGVPRGTLTEICGSESSGRTAVMFALLSQSTRQGECCAWIDTTGVFDPASAAEMGADLERLLWVDCGGNAEHALKSADLLIQAGGFGLVVLDLADTPEREARRISLASWFRLRHAAERTGAALVAVERETHARSCSTLRIALRRRQAVWVGKLLRGLSTQAESDKQYRVQTAEFVAVR